MRLVACKACHTQYDVSDVSTGQVACRCGSEVDVAERESRDLAIHRCSSCGAHVAVGDDTCDYCGSGIVRDPRPTASRDRRCRPSRSAPLPSPAPSSSSARIEFVPSRKRLKRAAAASSV